MKNLYVGIDVSKDDFKVGVKDEQNNQIMPVKRYTHDIPGMEALCMDVKDMKERLKCSAIFGMEATGIYHLALYQYLLDAGEDVKVFNSLELKRFKGRIRKTKTDALDALAIADALLLATEPTYHPTTEPELIHLRELCRLRFRLVEKKSTCKNQAIRNMDVLCRGYTKIFRDVFSPSSIAVMKAAFRATNLFKITVKRLTETLEPFMPRSAAKEKAMKLDVLFKQAVVPEHMLETCILELHMLIHQYELLKHQLERVELRIEKRVKKINPHMLTVPGLGVLTIGVIFGELGYLPRFKSLDQLTAFAGLDPSIMESGRSRRTGHISKRGSPMLRDALYNAALSATRVNPVCQKLYQRLRSKGKHHKVCMVAVARKLLHIAYAVETKQKDFYVPAYIVAEQQDNGNPA